MSSSVQPQTQKQTNAQYAIAIRVPLELCINGQFDIETVLSRAEAKWIKDMLNNGKKCLNCTSSNAIATRPDLKTKKHAENVLLYPPGNSPMDKLLEKADENSCIVFYSYNSPCMKTCMNSMSEDNILEGLSNWINKSKAGMNVFVFEKTWQKDSKKDVKEIIKKINDKVVVYRCKTINNVLKCEKCVVNGNVQDFCVPVE